ncbi:MAG TPA: DUF4349 domain-containing protein [Candidatus Paceibacterota bacterium]|uniref:DUF4349 domain-containing protein n=1 Tax=Candidatus Ryanbacteria bacterium RIFCSPHIGHO2_01_FULL_45_22 TaxID=1802114 RepID=A0A1G2G3C0_9BACT|nr:MAG: hypothetical protein A2719_04425 [Candidatus Ryanbacteria bacterium RIFCSPHIGHO2_01_FULL_45_22]
MEQIQGDRSRKIPWVSIVFLILALLSLIFSSPSYSGYSPAYTLISFLVPILLLIAVAGFFFGLFRFFASADQKVKNTGVHILLWSLGGFVAVIGLWFLLETSYRPMPVYSVASPGMPTQGVGQGTAYYESDMAKSASSMIAPPYYPYPYGGEEVPVTDTREFLKRDYHATMRTREVPELARRIETTVRGFGGRIDQVESSSKSGYVGFVVPASKFEDFRTELESLVNRRFITVNISSQNLLPQKQNIEEQQKSVEESLAELRSERKKIVSAHTSVISVIQSKIDANAREQSALRSEITNDPNRQSQISSRLNVLAYEKANLDTDLANENSVYSNKINSIDAQIKNMETILTAVKDQDQDLLDTVATVKGNISIQWISLWEIMHLYLPGFWIPAILIIAALISYFWERRRLV